MSDSFDAADVFLDALIEWTFDHTEDGPWRDHLHQVLAIRARYPGGCLQWSYPVVLEQVLWALPRNGNFNESDLPEVLEALAQFLDVIDRHPHAEVNHSIGALAETCRDLRSDFIRAMGIAGRRSPNTRIMNAMVLKGGEIPTVAELQRRVDRATRAYNALTPVERARIAGPTIAPGFRPVGHDYLPLRVASQAEQQEQASGTRMLARMRDLYAYCEDGIKLTKKGNLTLADGRRLVTALGTDDVLSQRFGEKEYPIRTTEELPHLVSLVELAESARLLQRRQGRLFSVKTARRRLDDPLQCVQQLFTIVLDRGWPIAPDGDFGDFGRFATEAMLLDLYEMREPIPIEDLRGFTGQRLRVNFDLYTCSPGAYWGLTGASSRATVTCLAELTDLGIIRLDPADALSGAPDYIDGTAELTALGLALVHPLAAAIGNAPLTRSAADADADNVLPMLAGRGGDNAAVEAAQWLAAAEPDDRQRLIRGAVLSDSEVERQLGLQALTIFEAAGHEVPDPVGPSEPGAARWATWRTILRERATRTPPELLGLQDEEWTELLGEVLVTLGLDGLTSWLETEPAESRTARVQRLWRTSTPIVADLLAGVAEADPDRDIRKQARKSLFKMRSR